MLLLCHPFCHNEFVELLKNTIVKASLLMFGLSDLTSPVVRFAKEPKKWHFFVRGETRCPSSLNFEV